MGNCNFLDDTKKLQGELESYDESARVSRRNFQLGRVLFVFLLSSDADSSLVFDCKLFVPFRFFQFFVDKFLDP